MARNGGLFTKRTPRFEGRYLKRQPVEHGAWSCDEVEALEATKRSSAAPENALISAEVAKSAMHVRTFRK